MAMPAFSRSCLKNTCLLAAFLFVLPVSAESFRPLLTQGTRTLKAKEIEVDLAFEFRDDIAFPFTRSQDQPEREEFSIPRIGLNIGLSDRVELQFNYALLAIDEAPPGLGHESGSGDFRFFTKYRFFDQTEALPDVAVYFGAKLPNANDQRRLGTDRTDLFLDLLVGRSNEYLQVAANAGLGIFEIPTRSGQDDLLLYGAALIYQPGYHLEFLPRGLDLAIEVNGQFGSNEDNNISRFQGALRYKLGPVRFYAGGSTGLSLRAEKRGALLGLTWQHSF